MRRNPLVYEINTWVWLADLSQRFGRTITLGSIPVEVYDEIASWYPDAVWLMGVWERSPQGREIALNHPDLQFTYQRALPNFAPADVVGSPYAIRRYVVDAHLGSREELAVFRAQLQRRKISLFLDYVPNHVAIDHHWTEDCPDCLVRGSEEDLVARSAFYFRGPDSVIFAHGRDPYWPAWTDTAQVNVFSKEGREQSIAMVQDIADQCDGIRCDMAMLLVSRIFGGLWAPNTTPPPTEFWSELIPTVKKRHPEFVFMAEVYWEMEAELQSLGFDYTYDKRLYDRLLHESIYSVRDHLLASSAYQQRMVRFVENHDEQRALAAFGLERSLAAAVISMALPGAKLVYEGQFEGRRIKLPVQLGVRAIEPVPDGLVAFYQKFTRELSKNVYHDGVYMALASQPILGNDAGHDHLTAFAWVLGSDWRIVVVNYSDQPSQGRIMLPRPEFSGLYTWAFYDALNPAQPRLLVGDDLLTSGLTVDLPPYGAAMYTVARE